MFGVECRFRDTKNLADALNANPYRESIRTVTSAELQSLHSRIIAFDNLPRARDLYGFHASHDFAVLLGNECRGLSREFASIATDRVQVPMFSRRINCLNVAAASAVALYYLCAPPVAPMAVRTDPRNRRPELLLLAPGDHFELGSTIRSAAGLGWERAFVEDRNRAWFGCDRSIRSEGRAAARRGKNEILLIPTRPENAFSHARVTVITCKQAGAPLRRANLAHGPAQLIVIPDESQPTVAAEDWTRFGRTVEFAHLELPRADFKYHYRLVATIALAEISRQVGRHPKFKAPAGPRLPVYDYRIEELAQTSGEIVSMDQLKAY